MPVLLTFTGIAVSALISVILQALAAMLAKALKPDCSARSRFLSACASKLAITALKRLAALAQAKAELLLSICY